MKAEIRKDGKIWVIAETPEEAFAIKYLFPTGSVCSQCGQMRTPIIVDTSILMDQKND